MSSSPNRRDVLRIGVAGTAGGVLPLSAAAGGAADFAVHQGRPVEAVRIPGHVELREIWPCAHVL